MHSVSVELLNMELGPSLFFAKAALMVILLRQMLGFKYCFLKLVFLNGKGPAAEGKAVGLSLKLEVDLRRKNLEHAMHPQGGGGS